MDIKVRPRLGEILRERRITQLELEKMSGVPQGSISRFDRNSQHRDEHLFAISRALDIKIEDLFIVDEQ
mgnify:CR=1 FL=1